MTAEEIKEALSDKQIKAVSFDIFDTLLLRPFYTPTDIFELLDARVTALLGTIDRIDFKCLLKAALFFLPGHKSVILVGEHVSEFLFQGGYRDPVLG